MRALLVTTAKNEAPYFLEWVAHHLEVGFTEIVVFQNDSDDLTHETLTCLSDIGAIRYSVNKAARGRHQVRAYKRASEMEAYRSADWVMALDLDEFLVVKTGSGTLGDLLDMLPACDVVRLNWRLFGNSGHETISDDLVSARFVMANHQLGPADHYGAYKCLFRPHLFERPGIHQPFRPAVAADTIRYTNGSGLSEPDYLVRNYNATDPGGCAHAQINHYVLRDVASFMLKTVRGSAHRADRAMGHRYWRFRNKNFVPDGSMAPWQGRIRARMAALDAASGGRLMELRQTAIFLHMARYYTMLQDPQHQAFRRYCLDHPNAFDWKAEAEPVAT